MMPRLITYITLLLLPALCAAQGDSAQYGVASYYHNKFQGRKTSNGEIFRNDSLTAAHKRLPFGTRVRVTNLSNDSTVIVRINDRLPQSSRRSIDLSQAAARQLNMIRSGIVKARIEVLPQQKADTPLTPAVDTAGIRQIVAETFGDTVIRKPSAQADTLGEILVQTYAEAGCTIEKITVKKQGKTTVYEKKTWNWGGVFWYKDSESITEAIYKKETGTK